MFTKHVTTIRQTSFASTPGHFTVGTATSAANPIFFNPL
jgi:hypothetical protein